MINYQFWTNLNSEQRSPNSESLTKTNRAVNECSPKRCTAAAQTCDTPEPQSMPNGARPIAACKGKNVKCFERLKPIEFYSTTCM